MPRQPSRKEAPTPKAGSRTIERFGSLLSERIGRTFEMWGRWWRIVSSYAVEACDETREVLRWPDVVLEALESTSAIQELEQIITAIPPATEEKLMTIREFAESEEGQQIPKEKILWLARLLGQRKELTHGGRGHSGSRSLPGSHVRLVTQPKESQSTPATVRKGGGTWRSLGEVVDSSSSSASETSESGG